MEMVQLKKWFICFSLFVFILTGSSSLAEGTENEQMIRIKKNLVELLKDSQSDTCDAQIREVVRGLYSLTNAVPFQINLKNLLKAKRGASDAEVLRVEQKKKDYFLSMTWVILRQAGFELEKRGDSILVKGGTTNITLSAGPKDLQIQPEEGKATLDLCIHYPRLRRAKDPLGYDYTTSVVLPKLGKKRLKHSGKVHYEEISSREKNLPDLLHRLVSGDDEEITHFESLLSRVFSSIPATWRVDREAFYHSLLHVFFTLNNIDIVSESCSSDGRIDSYVKIGEGPDQKVVIFEFKRNDSTGLAVKQVMETGYYEQFLLHPIHPVNEVFFVGCRFREKKRGGTELEPTCWPFKCTNTGDDIKIESLRGTEQQREDHTYSNEDVQQMEPKKSIGKTPVKAPKPKTSPISMDTANIAQSLTFE